MRRLLPLVLRPTPPTVTLGLLVAAACVVVETVLAYPLERVAHASSLGVYLLGVVAVSTLWGVRLGAPTAVVSVLTWDYFYAMPGESLIHTGDWLALAVFLGVALPAGWVADLARSRALEVDAGCRAAEARRREADLAAELAHLLLRAQDLRSALPAAAQRLAQTLELPHAVIEFDTVAGDEHHTALPLRDGATQLGTLLVPADLAEPIQRRLRERIVPSLEALLRSALERQAIGFALETSRDEQRLLAEQQAALRRVATHVARGVSATQLFAAVASEMGRILQAECTEIVRYGTDRASYTVVGSWTRSEPKLSRPLGSRWQVEIGLVVELLHTERPARIDFYRDGYGEGEVATWLREKGITSLVGCPIVVEGGQWGAMFASSTKAEPQPADTEERMQEFTELVATAIANTESRTELRLLADQQAALRRVATLVARGVSPTQLFAAVSEQMGQILGAECANVARYSTDRASYTVVGSWSRDEPALARPLGSRWPLHPGLVGEVMLRTGRPARINGYDDGDGEVSRWLREHGITLSVGCPIVVEGRQWGATIAAWTGAEPRPADTEERMLDFTELVATAIANTESRTELRVLADQQAALRRVATLVARGVSPTQIFRAVASEMGQILDAEFIEIVRYEDDMFTVVGSWTRSKPTLSRRLGSRWPIHPGLVAVSLLRTGRPDRIDFYRDGYGDGEVSTWHRENGITSVVGCPIVVEGGQWGAMCAFSTKAESQPADTEERMLEFIELVATAIANTESRTELISSRARVVAAADQTRRRIERDLHDGTQQRLLALGLNLRAAEAATPPELDQLHAQLAHTAQGLTEALTELQEISRGIHPAILSNGGIAPALKTLARRSSIPVELTVNANQRLAEPAEVAAYYIVSEALTNATKHAHASVVHVNLDAHDTILQLSVHDDGNGGADPSQGSGLTGLRDRVEALNGTIEIVSPTGGGTLLTVTIPIHNELPTTSPLTPARRLRAGRAGRGPAHARTGTAAAVATNPAVAPSLQNAGGARSTPPPPPGPARSAATDHARNFQVRLWSRRWDLNPQPSAYKGAVSSRLRGKPLVRLTHRLSAVHSAPGAARLSQPS